MARPCILLIAAALAAAVAGCGGAGDEALDVVIIGGEPPALVDPSAGTVSAPNAVLLSSVAQGLVRFDARGQIEPGLAERWNVSDDGLSYIFRLTAGEWQDGRKIMARDVSRILSRQLRGASHNALKDALGAVEEIVPMTERVIEIRLRAPRPNLLQLLAQPEFAIVRERLGTGPFQPEAKSGAPGAIALTHRVRIIDAPDRIENIWLRAAPASRAIADFRAEKADLVLGGTFVDLPLVRRVRLGRRELRFDPVAGLFGLAPGRKSGPLEDADVRNLLSRAIDRDELIASLNVPGLVPRATLLQAGLEGIRPPTPPQWASVPVAERRVGLIAQARRLLGGEKTELRVALPNGPGATVLLNRLAADWAPLGITLVRVGAGDWADLKLLDSVAPSTSPAWFVRTFRCEFAPLCSEEADELMDSAREAAVAVQRTAMLAEAGRLLDGETLFIPLAAPIRWSLVSDDVNGFAENIFARHPLTGLGDRPGRERQ